MRYAYEEYRQEIQVVLEEFITLMGHSMLDSFKTGKLSVLGILLCKMETSIMEKLEIIKQKMKMEFIRSRI